MSKPPTKFLGKAANYVREANREGSERGLRHRASIERWLESDAVLIAIVLALVYAGIFLLIAILLFDPDLVGA